MSKELSEFLSILVIVLGMASCSISKDISESHIRAAWIAKGYVQNGWGNWVKP